MRFFSTFTKGFAGQIMSIWFSDLLKIYKYFKDEWNKNA